MLPVRAEARFSDIDDCAAALAADLAQALNAATGPAASIALSGGRTPEKILPLLAGHAVDWSRVAVTLTDERCVPANDPASNALLIRRYFLERGAAAASFHPLWPGNTRDPALADVPWPLTAVYLGMGADGHVASLFPAVDQAGFDGPGRLVAGRAPTPPNARISLSLPSILKAKHIFLQLSGSEKIAVYERARLEPPTPMLPVSLVLAAAHPSFRVYIAET